MVRTKIVCCKLIIESNIPNPGFAFVDKSSGYRSSSIFTASTAVSISQANKV